MKKKRYTEEQIVRILNDVREGKSVAETSRQYGVSENAIYVWRKKYGEMDVSDVKRLKELEAENRKLKEIVAEQALDNKALKFLLSKNL
jgi:putative transposase